MSRTSNCHPIVLATYFLSVLVITMFINNPIFLIFALLGSILYSITLENPKAFLKSLSLYLPLFLLISITNPLFSHNGVTPLFFLNGNAITLEAIFYGINLAVMLISVMYWFKCFNIIMTSDKLLYLTGKISPKISLVFSSALRFIPLFKQQAQKIRQAQKAMGLFASDSWFDKIKSNVRVFSSLVTWSLENAIDTGISMKSRGYSNKGKTHFSLFHFSVSDAILLFIIFILDTIILLTAVNGKLDFSFYPEISSISKDFYTLLSLIAFGLLSFMPIILEIKEKLFWIYYKSKI